EAASTADLPWSPPRKALPSVPAWPRKPAPAPADRSLPPLLLLVSPALIAENRTPAAPSHASPARPSPLRPHGRRLGAVQPRDGVRPPPAGALGAGLRPLGHRR